MVNAILFDFDGVILESVELKKEGFAELYSSLGPEVVTYVEQYHNAHGGVSRFNKIKHFNQKFQLPSDETTINKMADQFSEIVLSKIKSCPFVDGALPFLKQFGYHLPLFVVSATPEAELIGIAIHLKIDCYFKGIYGSPKGKSEIIKGILTQQQLSSDTTLFVGDALTDLKAAQETGVMFLGRITKGQEDLFPSAVNKSADIYKIIRNLVL